MTLKQLALTMTATILVFSGCEKEMTVNDAVSFLYEYMSIADKGDYSEDFLRPMLKWR